MSTLPPRDHEYVPCFRYGRAAPKPPPSESISASRSSGAERLRDDDSLGLRRLDAGHDRAEAELPKPASRVARREAAEVGHHDRLGLRRCLRDIEPDDGVRDGLDLRSRSLSENVPGVSSERTSRIWGRKPAPRSVRLASSTPIPTTSGTAIRSGPAATMSVTSVPRSTRAPAAGACSTTSRSGRSEGTARTRTVKPASSRSERASAEDRPTASGTAARAGAAGMVAVEPVAVVVPRVASPSPARRCQCNRSRKPGEPEVATRREAVRGGLATTNRSSSRRTVTG
jgi:hypothetical protein